MPATSIKLSIELKRRIDALVANSGMTVHAFMVEAIERETARAEQRKRFHEEANEAEAGVLSSGGAYDVREVFDYLEGKINGKKITKPRPKKWPPSN